MLSKISFTLVTNPRAQFTHFIENSGMVAVLDNEDTLQEAHVGVFNDFGPLPSEVQFASIHFMAEVATVKNPAVEVSFGPGTSPFQAPTTPDKQLAFCLAQST